MPDDSACDHGHSRCCRHHLSGGAVSWEACPGACARVVSILSDEVSVWEVLAPVRAAQRCNSTLTAQRSTELSISCWECKCSALCVAP